MSQLCRHIGEGTGRAGIRAIAFRALDSNDIYVRIDVKKLPICSGLWPELANHLWTDAYGAASSAISHLITQEAVCKGEHELPM